MGSGKNGSKMRKYVRSFSQQANHKHVDCKRIRECRIVADERVNLSNLAKKSPRRGSRERAICVTVVV